MGNKDDLSTHGADRVTEATCCEVRPFPHTRACTRTWAAGLAPCLQRQRASSPDLPAHPAQRLTARGMRCIRASARTGSQVDDAFLHLVRQMMGQRFARGADSCGSRHVSSLGCVPFPPLAPCGVARRRVGRCAGRRSSRRVRRRRKSRPASRCSRGARSAAASSCDRGSRRGIYSQSVPSQHTPVCSVWKQLVARRGEALQCPWAAVPREVGPQSRRYGAGIRPCSPPQARDAGAEGARKAGVAARVRHALALGLSRRRDLLGGDRAIRVLLRVGGAEGESGGGASE